MAKRSRTKTSMPIKSGLLTIIVVADGITCQLQTFNQAEAAEYDDLSYAWGTEQAELTI